MLVMIPFPKLSLKYSNVEFTDIFKGPRCKTFNFNNANCIIEITQVGEMSTCLWIYALKRSYAALNLKSSLVISKKCSPNISPDLRVTSNSSIQDKQGHF